MHACANTNVMNASPNTKVMNASQDSERRLFLEVAAAEAMPHSTEARLTARLCGAYAAFDERCRHSTFEVTAEAMPPSAAAMGAEFRPGGWMPPLPPPPAANFGETMPPPPPAAIFNPGDWICRACCFHNPVDNACRRCLAARCRCYEFGAAQQSCLPPPPPPPRRTSRGGREEPHDAIS